MPAFFTASLAEHDSIPVAEIVGNLSLCYSGQYQNQKKDLTRSWDATVPLIKSFYQRCVNQIADLDRWAVLYEYPIPRRSKRIDVVLLSPRVIFIVECKIGADEYSPADERQLQDYCLDLRDFHLESAGRLIIPVLLCTNAPDRPANLEPAHECLAAIQYANASNLSRVLVEINLQFCDAPKSVDAAEWNYSAYMPTPNIIEAARVIYSDKTVAAIARNQAGADNLERTQATVLSAINNARVTQSKIICFITGVPGAGKTLAGLNIVHGRDFQAEDKDLGIFLSGNSPLVKVLSEALAVDFARREGIDRTESRRRVSTFITNVHSFIDDYYGDAEKVKKKPPERVLIYDEAQRAWTAAYKSRKSYGAITHSEPDILLSIMTRFDGWAVIVCLIGGGQEINTGEAGLREWGRSLETKYADWTVYISPNLKEGDHTTGHTTLFDSTPSELKVFEDERLHLSVGIRAPRAKGISEWVSVLLDGDITEARHLLTADLDRYPIRLTRNLESAKKWLREKVVEGVRTGMVASSGGRRLRAVGPDPYHGLRGDSSQEILGAWYLNPPDDVRSSNFLEVVATEYAIQGLEIDWAAVLWDADMRMVDGKWDFRSFVGTRWQNVNDQQKRYTLNKYRVLLTRAREGMIIFVPEGNTRDITRLPNFYDGTFEYLKSIGVPAI